jgi:predicted nucleic acid-binding protein
VRRGLPAPVRQGLELGDALIAASASVHNLILRTRNRRHYPMKTLAFY